MGKQAITIKSLDWGTLNENIIMYGRTIPEGKSIAVKINGCTFPFYVLASQWPAQQLREISGHLRSKRVKFGFVKRKVFNCRLEDTGDGIDDKKFKMLRLDCKNIIDFYSWRKKFQHGFSEFGLQVKPCTLFNAHIKPLLSFFHINNMSSTGAYEVYRYQDTQKFSTSEIDIEVDISNLNKSETLENAKIVIASYDIESEGTTFEDKAVFQIGITFKTLMDDTTQQPVLLSWKECAPIEGTIVKSYKTEKDLILGYIDTMLEYDPDIITGFNTFGFDNEFLYGRAAMHHIEDEFKRLSRTKTFERKILNDKMSGKGEGFLKTFYFNWQGRIQMDLLPIFRKNFKLDAYSLSHISQTYLQDDKVNLDYQDMFDLWDKGRGSPEDLAIIGEYCVKDTVLPINLIEKLSLLTNAIEYSNIVYFPLGMLFQYGETSKSFSIICHEAERQKFCIAENKSRGNPFQGATVLDPVKGMYLNDHTAVQDFKSLYPSIMIAENLCPSTYSTNEELIKKYPEKFITNNINGREISFYQGRTGVVPIILKRLLSERQRVKAQMKEQVKGTFAYQILDAKQLALKISCNSICKYILFCNFLSIFSKY